MQTAHKKGKPRPTFDIYEYIFKLEEEVKALRTECDLMQAHAEQLETELEDVYSEMRNSEGMPRAAAQAKELRNRRDAY